MQKQEKYPLLYCLGRGALFCGSKMTKNELQKSLWLKNGKK